MKSFNKFLDVPTVTESIADQPLTAMPPAQIILTRVNFRSFGNDLSIALFYAKALDRYFTVPFTPSQGAADGESTGSDNAGLNYIVPQNLEAFLAGSNKKILDGWLKGLASDKKRQDFLDNLSAVMATAASKNDANEFHLVVNKYKELKLQKIGQSEFEKYADIAARGAAIAAIFGLVVLLLLVSLMLVLLAIERHVRIAAPNTPAQPIIV